jgi:transposase
MTRLYGWAPRGRRLVAKAPHGHWKTATFLAALRNDRIEAPCVFDGPINGERFLAYVEQFLAPTLKPGDIVVLDNLGSHKGKRRARPSEPSALASSSFPNTRPTATPTSRFSPRSKALCERPSRATSTPSPRKSPKPSTPSPLRNAQTTLEAQAMRHNKCRTLKGECHRASCRAPERSRETGSPR